MPNEIITYVVTNSEGESHEIHVTGRVRWALGLESWVHRYGATPGGQKPG